MISNGLSEKRYEDDLNSINLDSFDISNDELKKLIESEKYLTDLEKIELLNDVDFTDELVEDFVKIDKESQLMFEYFYKDTSSEPQNLKLMGPRKMPIVIPEFIDEEERIDRIAGLDDWLKKTVYKKIKMLKYYRAMTKIEQWKVAKRLESLDKQLKHWRLEKENCHKQLIKLTGNDEYIIMYHTVRKNLSKEETDEPTT